MTTTKREQAKNEMYARITRHGEDIKKLFALSPETDPVALCKTLRRLEAKAWTLALKGCNVGLAEGEWDRETGKILNRTDALLKFSAKGIPVFVNGDARGYALKIDCEWLAVDTARHIYKDAGGYGILAPDLTNSFAGFVDAA